MAGRKLTESSVTATSLPVCCLYCAAASCTHRAVKLCRIEGLPPAGEEGRRHYGKQKQARARRRWTQEREESINMMSYVKNAYKKQDMQADR